MRNIILGLLLGMSIGAVFAQVTPPTLDSLNTRLTAVETLIDTLQSNCVKVFARLNQIDLAGGAIPALQLQATNATNSFAKINLQLSTVSVLTALGLANQQQLVALQARVVALENKNPH